MEVFKVSLSASCTSLKAASIPPQESRVCASVVGTAYLVKLAES